MKGNRRFSAVLIFSLCVFTGIYAKNPKKSGIQEDDVLSLQEIDRLIADTNYDKALEELNRYIDKNPENFDNAQIRVAKIMNARNRYSRLAEELITLIIEEPDNAEQIYKITSELEQLEKYPSDKQLAFIRETRIAAEFNYFRKEFDRVQRETLELTEKDSYVAAVNKAREGFPLYRDRFYEEWNQSEVVQPVNGALAKIEANLVFYADIQKRLTDSVSEFVKAVGTEKTDDINKTWTAVNANFREFASIRNAIYESGETFRETFELMKTMSDTELTDASFLPFVSRFTLGQADNPESGITGAMDRQWNKLCTVMKDSVWEKVSKYYSDFEKSVPEKIMESSSAVLNASAVPLIRQFSTLARTVNGLYDTLTPSLNETEKLEYDEKAAFALELPVHVNGLYSAKLVLQEKDRALRQISVPEDPSDAEMNRSDFSSQLLALTEEFQKGEAAFTKTTLLENEWTVPYRDLILSQKTSVLQARFNTFSGELAAFRKESLSWGWETLCRYLKESDGGYVRESRETLRQAETLSEGILNEETYYTEKYPDRALETSVAVQAAIDSQIAVINRHMNLVPSVGDQEQGRDLQRELDFDRNELLSLKTSFADLASLSRSRLQMAEKSRNEAELRFNQAEIALQTDNFETARKRLQDSRTKYNESLDTAFSLQLQALSDSRLQALGERINQKENELVVREVRQLKTLAKNEYYAGNFEASEKLLNQAKTRWAVTNVDEDLEISNLMAVVNTALSMKTGRTIPPSAPLFPEMSQLLSIASQYYEQGADLISRNNREEGEQYLMSALQKLQELQLVYPLNQDAALMTLRIQKILNPTEYEQMFERKIAEARINYRNKAKQQEAYTDLLNLYEINPSYPGLKNLIYNVELEIGIRKKPVDNSAQNKAVALTKEARTLFNRAGTDEAKLRDALAKIDEAIALNPDSTDAINLKDSIQTKIGGNSAVVLTSEDESRYQKAILEMQRNNVITANAIVEQLLQKQSNRKSQKILELQKKIKALL